TAAFVSPLVLSWRRSTGRAGIPNVPTRRAPSCSARRLAGCLKLGAKIEPRFVRVMRSAAELQVVDVCGAAGRERYDVMKLEKPRFATTSVGPDEGAAGTVARPDGAFDGCWKPAARRSRPGCLSPNRSWSY